MCDSKPEEREYSREVDMGWSLTPSSVTEIKLKLQKLHIRGRQFEAEEYTHPLKTRSKKTKIS